MSPVHLDDVGHYFFFILRYWKSNGEPIATGDFVHRKTFYRKKEILFFPERICNKWKYPFVVSLRYHHQTFHFLMDFSFGVAGRIASKENIFQRGSSASIFYFISFLNCFYILHTKKKQMTRVWFEIVHSATNEKAANGRGSIVFDSSHLGMSFYRFFVSRFWAKSQNEIKKDHRGNGPQSTQIYPKGVGLSLLQAPPIVVETKFPASPGSPAFAHREKKRKNSPFFDGFSLCWPIQKGWSRSDEMRSAVWTLLGATAHSPTIR